jgi:hypothetical protein
MIDYQSNVNYDEEKLSDSELRKIVRGAPSENLCLFYACYNSLCTARERMAFAAVSEKEYRRADFNPAAKFLSFTVQDECDRLMAEKWGYTQEDMRRYLEHLKDLGYAEAYLWKRLRGVTLVEIATEGIKQPIGRSFVLLGRAAPNNKPMRMKMENALKGLENIGRAVTRKCRRELAVSIVKQFESLARKSVATDHACALRVVPDETGEKTFEVVDNGKGVAKPLAQLGECIVDYNPVMLFALCPRCK